LVTIDQATSESRRRKWARSKHQQ